MTAALLPPLAPTKGRGGRHEANVRRLYEALSALQPFRPDEVPSPDHFVRHRTNVARRCALYRPIVVRDVAARVLVGVDRTSPPTATRYAMRLATCTFAQAVANHRAALDRTTNHPVP